MAETLRGVGGLVFVAHGDRFANELGRRNCVAGEMWNDKPPFRLSFGSGKHYSGRGVMKVQESGTTLASDMGVPVSKAIRLGSSISMGSRQPKMWESIEALIQASLKRPRIPIGRSFLAYRGGKSWDEVPGKTGSGKKFHRNVISGADFTADVRHVPRELEVIAGGVLQRGGCS